MQDNQCLLQASNLTRQFGKVAAVDKLSLALHRGDILGLLGLNGAGKSTTLSMFSGVLAPSSGFVKVANKDIEQYPVEAKSHIGYLPDTPPLYPDLRVREYLSYCAQLHGIGKAKLKEAIERSLNQCLLEEVSHQMIGNLSKGFRQRVGLAQAIIHQPDLLILDEPSSGLDPLQRIQIRELIKSLSQDSAIILSSHILSEVTSVCQRVAVIHQGKLIHEQPLFNHSHSEINKHYLRLEQDVKIEELQSLNSIRSAEVINHKGAFHINVSKKHHKDVINEINQHHWQVLEFTLAKDFLEEKFADLTTGKTSDTEIPA